MWCEHGRQRHHLESLAHSADPWAEARLRGSASPCAGLESWVDLDYREGGAASLSLPSVGIPCFTTLDVEWEMGRGKGWWAPQ